MKTTIFLKGVNILTGLSLFFICLFASCRKEKINANEPEEKPVTQHANLAQRSVNATKLLIGIDWTGQQSFIDMINPFVAGTAGYSFGNTIPSNAKTACSVVGDFNGDGIDEYIIGYNSPTGPVLIKNTGPYIMNNVTRIYSGTTFWTLVAVAAADFDGDGRDELITALNSAQGPALYKGDATSIGYAKIYQGPTSLSIVAVAGGDFSGNGQEELISAFNSSSGPSLYRSRGSDVGSSFYQGSTFWRIAALTAADFDNNDGRDELITGLNSSQGPALYKGDATTIGYIKIYQGPASIGSLQSLCSGRYGSTCEMYVGFYNSTAGMAVYRHDGTNLGNLVLSRSNPSYVLKTLASGTFNFDWE